MSVFRLNFQQKSKIFMLSISDKLMLVLYHMVFWICDEYSCVDSHKKSEATPILTSIYNKLKYF